MCLIKAMMTGSDKTASRIRIIITNHNRSNNIRAANCRRRR